MTEITAELIIKRFAGVQRCNQEDAALLPCPRCGEYRMAGKLCRNAVSRQFREVMICSPCGTGEAIYAMFEPMGSTHTGQYIPASSWAIAKGTEKNLAEIKAKAGAQNE